MKLLTLNNNLPLIQANGLKLDSLIAEETFHSLTKLFSDIIPLRASIGEHIEQASYLLEQFVSKSHEELSEGVTFKAAHDGLLNLMESEQMKGVAMAIFQAPINIEQPVLQAPPGIEAPKEEAKPSNDWADAGHDEEDEDEDLI